MPMSWTPENDRLLLLKLIETHGIVVDSSKIVAAWPDEGIKPTARAVTERFVKLRQLAGIKASISKGTPGKARPRVSKYTTPKKRKTKEDSESDAEDHHTEDEYTPTKKSAQRASGGRARARGSGRGVGSPAVRIKSEYPSDSIESPDFNRLSSRATELRESAEDPFSSSRGSAPGFYDMPNGHRTHHAPTGFNMIDDTAVSKEGYAGLRMPVHDTLSLQAQHLHLSGNGFDQVMQAPSIGHSNTTSVGASRPSVAPSDASATRARSARKASTQASEGMTMWLRQQKEEDEKNGEKTSEEESQASEYEDAVGDYI